MKKHVLIVLLGLLLICKSEIFSQDTLGIKYPFLLFSERGKEWVFTPEQTDIIIRKIERERVLIEQLRIGADRRDSLIRVLEISSNKFENLYTNQVLITDNIAQQFNISRENYLRQVAISKELEEAYKREKELKNRYKSLVVGATGAIAGLVVIGILL